MTDRSQLESLDGQQYLLVRPEGELERFFDQTRDRLRLSLPHGVASPNTGHVTLRGFSEPQRVDALKRMLAEWAVRQNPIELRVDGIDGFPPPFQILIARLERTRSLVSAYAQLTHELDNTDFRRIGELPLDEWVFHMSLVYANILGEPAWEEALEGSRAQLAGPVATAASVDFVWYEDGVEHSETLALSSGPSAQTG
jgi:2'-5' RNA ligase